MKKRLIISLAAVIIIGVILILTAPQVEKLEIEQQSISLTVGESIHLSVQGYFKDGQEAAEKDLAKLDLLWESNSRDAAFSVDANGLLTALKPGSGNVWVESADGKLNSRAITVIVEE